MFIDYLTLMLINVVAGLVIMAAWVFLDMGTPNERRWVPGLLMSGVISLLTGLHMMFTWPLPGAFNIVFGEMTVFFGILLLGLAITLILGIDLVGVSIYALLVGIASIIMGIRVIQLGMTQAPMLSGLSFIWIGMIGVFALPMLRFRNVFAFRVFGTVGLLVAAVLWATIGYRAYWNHLDGSFRKWKPIPLEYQLKMNRPPMPAAPQKPADK